MITVAMVCKALREDAHPESGLCHWAGSHRRGAVCVPEEIWLADAHLWVRVDGRRASGYPLGGQFQAVTFGLLGRWRIRGAARDWRRRHA